MRQQYREDLERDATFHSLASWQVNAPEWLTPRPNLLCIHDEFDASIDTGKFVRFGQTLGKRTRSR